MRARAFLFAAAVGCANQTWSQEIAPPQSIQAIADGSAFAKVSKAPRGYVRGIALVYARSVCHPERAETKVASASPRDPIDITNPNDAASVFDAEFRRLNIPNKPDSGTMLRHTYVLLADLGLKESSGRYCVGRYMAQGFSGSDEAEAGLFQTSWGAHRVDPNLKTLFKKYQDNPGMCLLQTFEEGVSCGKQDDEDWDSTKDPDHSGVEWQHLTKRCPAFAVEYASTVVRKSGGSHGEFGPIRCYAGTKQGKLCPKLTIYPEADVLFSKIQDWIRAHPVACQTL